MTDSQIEDLNRGGHDPQKFINAYKAAYECEDKPTVILAMIKGYGVGSSADNTTHQVKKLSEENIKEFIEKFNLPIDEKGYKATPLFKIWKKSKEYKYLIDQR